MTPQEIADAISMLKRELISINVMLKEDDDFDKAQLAHDKVLHEKIISLLEQLKMGMMYNDMVDDLKCLCDYYQSRGHIREKEAISKALFCLSLLTAEQKQCFEASEKALDYAMLHGMK